MDAKANFEASYSPTTMERDMKRIFLSLLIAAALLLPAASPNATLASEPATATASQQIIQGLEHDLVFLDKLADEAGKKLYARDSQRRQNVRALERRFLELLIVLRSMVDSPPEASLIYQDIYNLASKIENLLSPLDRLKGSLDLNKHNLKEIAKDLDQYSLILTSPGYKAEIARLIKQMEKVEHRFQALSLAVAVSARPARDLLERVEQRLGSLQISISELWLGLFLQPMRPFTDLDTWHTVPTHFDFWLGSLPRFLLPKLPNDREELGAMLLSLLLFCLPLLALGFWLFYKKFAPGLGENPRARSQILRFTWLFSLAVSLLIYTSQGEYPEIWIIDILAILFLAKAILFLATGLRNLQLGREDCSPFEPLFWLYALLNLAALAEMPLVLFVLLWAPGSLVAIFFLGRRLHPEQPKLERRLTVASQWVCGLVLLLTVTGWSMLSTYLMIAWLMFALGLQLVYAAKYFLNQAIIKAPSKEASLFYGLASGLGTPILWLLLLAGLVLCLAHQLGGIHLLSTAISWNLNWQGLNVSFADVMSVIILFFICKYLIYVIHSLLEQADRWSRLKREMVPPLQAFTSYALWILFAYLMLRILGVNLTSLLVVIGGMSVGIGFGLRNLISNFVSGLLLLFGRSISQGDVIEVGDRLGRVLKINIRTTLIRTLDNAIIFVPNDHIVSNELINWTRNDHRVRRDIEVGVVYGSDIEQVESILIETAANNPHVLSSPKPKVLLFEFADSALLFRLRVWIDSFDHRRVMESTLRKAVYQALGKAGVEIAFPQMDVHIKEFPMAEKPEDV